MNTFYTREFHNPWAVLKHKTIFVSCSQDMAHAVPLIDAIVQELNSRVPVGDEWIVHHWSKSDVPWPSGGTWQEYIPRSSDDKVDIVICLLGERLGEPLPDYFPLPAETTLPAWVRHPWIGAGAAADGVPLTGTLFEIIDALGGYSKDRLRNRVLTYVKVDRARFFASGILPEDRIYGFRHHCELQQGGAGILRTLTKRHVIERKSAGLIDFATNFFANQVIP